MGEIVEKLHQGLTSKLPSYARPIFVRFTTELDLTGNPLILSAGLYGF